MTRLPSWTQNPGKVAIVHDWLTGMRGGEAILDAICELFPKADLYTLLWTDKKMSPAILNGRTVHTSYLQSLLRWQRFHSAYRQLLPLFPRAIESFDLSDYDLVISNSHCVAKGVRVRPDAVHIAHVLSPMRYIWDLFDDYFGPGRAGPLTRVAAQIVRGPLQRWDRRTTAGVDYIIAISEFVRERIRHCWQRESTVIHPFVDLQRYHYSDQGPKPSNYYLVVSAFAPYKRIDLAIAAFRELGLPLKVVGQGQDERRLRAMAAPNIQFLGALSNAAIAELYQRARAFIFPGLEDFGITPLESMASGRPVIGYGKGGLLDTVTSKTGIFFYEQSVPALVQAVREFEKRKFRSEDCVARAYEFRRERFVEKFTDFVVDSLAAGSTRKQSLVATT